MITRENCEKYGRCNCQECAFDSDEEMCLKKRVKLYREEIMNRTEEKSCPMCGDFPFCNNGEGCDNCEHYERWLKAEEKAVLL